MEKHYSYNKYTNVSILFWILLDVKRTRHKIDTRHENYEIYFVSITRASVTTMLPLSQENLAQSQLLTNCTDATACSFRPQSHRWEKITKTNVRATRPDLSEQVDKHELLRSGVAEMAHCARREPTKKPLPMGTRGVIDSASDAPVSFSPRRAQ